MAEKYIRIRGKLVAVTEDECALLEKIYFSGMSERQVAQSLAIPQRTLHDHKTKVLRNLKK